VSIKVSAAVFVLGLVLIIIFIPGLVFLIRDLVGVKFIFPLLGESYITATLLSAGTYRYFYQFKILDPPAVMGWMVIMSYLAISVFKIMGLLKIGQATYSQSDRYGSHGTSRFQRPREINNNYYKSNVGWFLGSLKSDQSYYPGMEAAYLAAEQKLNMQITVIGSPGSYKTTSLVLPNIFHIPYAYKDLDQKADLIITDPKSEVYRYSANYLKACGYRVYVLDFINLKYGGKLNPIDYITGDKELMEIAEGYVSSVSSSKGEKHIRGDAFWDDSESQLLGALIGYVKHVYKENVSLQTFSNVAEILASENVYDRDFAREFFIDAGVGGVALHLWNNFLMAEDKVRASILIGLATKLKLFAISGIKVLTGSTTVPIEMIGKKKDRPMALFIFMPDSDRTYMAVISVLLSTILKQLYKTAYKCGNTLDSPTYLILEEMANIGRIDHIQEMLGTMRGRKIYPMMIWQSLSQMKDRYRNSWEDILSMTDSQLYLGINDDFTARYASNALGNTTIKTQGISRKKEGIFLSASENESFNYTARKLLLPDEVKRFDNSRLILSQRAVYPAILHKVQYRFWDKKTMICKPKKVQELISLKDCDGAGDLDNFSDSGPTSKRK
jgi:type IV secretion system protein VirD4